MLRPPLLVASLLLASSMHAVADRGLRQADTLEQATYVPSPEAFLAALNAGARHIVVKRHLDMTAILQDDRFADPFGIRVSASTRSIRVRFASRLCTIARQPKRAVHAKCALNSMQAPAGCHGGSATLQLLFQVIKVWHTRAVWHSHLWQILHVNC